MKTFAEYRANRFADCPVHVDICTYLEQLAATTSTNIDNWSIGAYEGIPVNPLDKRAVNRVFFASKEAQAPAVALEPHHAEMLKQAASHMEQLKQDRMRDLEAQKSTATRRANEYSQHTQTEITKGWEATKEILALLNQPADFLTGQVKQAIQGGFWVWVKFEQGCLWLETAQNVFMSEVNKKAGINTRLNMGKYRVRIEIRPMRLRVFRHLANLVERDNYYHPYVNVYGDVCWGNAGATATKMLANGHLFDALNLLASLLMTYSSDSSPWRNLANFTESTARRLNADESPSNDEDDDRCEVCDNLTEDCDCYWCERCEERTGDERCETHWCNVCETYSAESCNCCHDCDSVEDECERCRECNHHDGHERRCEQRPCNDCDYPVSDCQCEEEDATPSQPTEPTF